MAPLSGGWTLLAAENLESGIDWLIWSGYARRHAWRDDKQASMLSMMSPGRRIAQAHPLRRIKAMTDEVLHSLSSTFDVMYSKTGRPSIPRSDC